MQRFASLGLDNQGVTDYDRALIGKGRACLPGKTNMIPLDDSRESVLVVDDDPISLAIACLLLESEGYTVLQARDGQSALELLQGLALENRPHTILVDLQMPGISGPNLAPFLRQLQPKATLAAMSASLPEGVAGFDVLLQKPLDPGSLKEVLENRRPVIPPSEQSAREGTILDEEKYAKLEGVMPIPALREVYMACLHDARIRVGNMRIAIHEGKLDAVRREAHAIKGGAGMVGAASLASAAAHLETGTYETSELPSLLNNLLFRCEEVERILFSKWQP